MTTNISEIKFKNSDFPLLSETIMNQEGIYKDGDFITITNLLILKQVLPALRIPPNINTLSVDDTILLNDGTGNSTTLDNTSLSITDLVNTATLNKNSFDLLYNGGDTELYMTNDPNNFRIDLIDSINNISSKITTSSIIFSDGVINPSLSYANNDLVLNADTGRLLLNANDNEFYLGQYSANTAPVIISSGNAGMSLNLNSRSGVATMGDCDNAFNSTKISVADTTSTITIEGTAVNFVNTTNTTYTSNATITAPNYAIDTGLGVCSFGDVNTSNNDTKIIVNDLTKDITLNSSDFVRIGDINGAINSTNITLTDSSSSVSINANSAINLQSSSAFCQIDGGNTRCYIYGGLRYRAGYTTVALTISALFTYGNMTYNGSSITQTLGTVSANTVGFQILITNVNATNLTMSAGGGQLIYSTIGAGTASKTLNTAHSHIFTAIQVGASTYGWSMV